LPPGADPLLFEKLISLAATICWEWGRSSDERLLFAVGGLTPTLSDGLTTPRHVRQILEQLAVQEPSAATDAGALVACLQTSRVPSAAVLVVGIGANRLSGMLEHKLRRPVNYLQTETVEEMGFYQRPR